MQDQAAGRYYRFTPIAYQVIGLMDGKLTVEELWEKASERYGDDAPTQGDMVQLLSQLHSADIYVQPDGLMFMTDFNAGLTVMQWDGA